MSSEKKATSGQARDAGPPQEVKQRETKSARGQRFGTALSTWPGG